MIKRLLACVREFKKDTILTPLFMVGEVSCECTIPMITANLINQIQAGCGMDVIVRLGLQLLIISLLSLTCGILSGWFAASAAAGFAKNLRHDIFYRVQGFSFSNIDKFSTSSLVTRLTTDVNMVQNSFMMIIRTGVRSPLMLVIAVIMSIRVGRALSWIFVGLLPILAIALIVLSKYAMPLFKQMFHKYDVLNNSVQENIQGIRVVKGFVREEYESKKFEKASGDVKGLATKAERILAFLSPIMSFCIYASMLLISFFSALLVSRTHGSYFGVGTLASMITYSMQVLSSLLMLSMIFVMITMSSASIKRINEVLAEESDLTNPENPVFEVPDGSVDFDHVSFKYSAQAEFNALSDVDLHIPSGATVGILGSTGSSKTTLIQLISRLYDASEGTVRVGGIDVRNYDLEALRNQVAVVLQKNTLFSGTIKDNLRWGDPDASDEDIERVCRLACADEFIQTFPDKYDTMITQGGKNVSGGQKQRLCIARALLKKPKILILDDSTSAVDTRTDALIRKAFRDEIPDTTKLIIAQRISSVQDADMIVILDNGRVNAVGSHEELLANNAIYQEVYTSQNKAGGEE